MHVLVSRTDQIARGILGWVLVCTFCLMTSIHHTSHSTFFHVGPSDTLVIFGIKFNTYAKYFMIVFYTIVSTIVRTLQQEVISPWIIQNVQNEREKSEYTKRHAYEIVMIDIMYRWFDWYMYMNILLAQVDMIIIELIGNVATSFYMTRLYLAPTTLAT